MGARRFVVGCWGIGWILQVWAGVCLAQDGDGRAFFEAKVRPLLIDRCQKCHGAEQAKSGLRLDSRAGMEAGGESGPAVVPGKPQESLLIEAVRQTGSLRMPPKERLSEAEIEVLERWVEQGAVWPGEVGEAGGRVASAGTLDEAELAERARHWSFRPIEPVEVPAVRDEQWPTNAIDRFLLAAMEAAGVRPAGPADRRTLIRRLTFDLIGLPPTVAEVEAFVNDGRPDAYERLVDRLLASPHYGERWGRHWLDLVRYAETAGHEFDYEIPLAWRYRDYVVRALNEDLPYDRFVREHLAGDLDPAPRRDQVTGRNESILGTGFLWLGEGVHSPVDLREEQVRRLDNQIDVVGKAFLGLTLACARCHDHKFDPIRQADYAALAGYFKSTRQQYAFLDRETAGRETLRSLRDELVEVAWEGWRSDWARAGGGTGAGGSAGDGVVVFEDFEGGTLEPWHASGEAFESPAEATVRVGADALVVVPAGVAHSARISERLSGVLRSPTFTIEQNYIQYRVAGRGGRIQLIIEGFEKIRDPLYGGLAIRVDHGDAMVTVVQDVRPWRGRRAYIELADGAVADFTGETTRLVGGDGFVGLDAVWFTNDAAAVGGGEGLPVRYPLEGLGGEGAALLSRFREAETALGEPTLGLAAVDGTGEDEHVLIRGNPRTPGPAVARRFLSVFDVREGDGADGWSARGRGEDSGVAGSRRWELAEAMMDVRHPLPARVVVNRLWQHHFGRGLVATPDDLGRMGEPPSHPELLDWLAAELIGSGWSLKSVHRRIVTSSAYRMASQGDPSADERDPGNRLWHRRELRRLEAEALRDALLAISGRLEAVLGGPSVPPHLTESMEGFGRPAVSGPLDGAGRRSLYINVRRNFLPPFWVVFDYPLPVTCMGRRHVSNVPAQALTLLNDPFVREQAERWARRARTEAGESAEATIEWMYQTAFARLPSAVERMAARAFLGEEPNEADWADLAHALVNVKEFLFIP
ncbi:MAG: cytochrome c [Isosphaeraceae bacterium]|nr:MAG: cytochrome c [Isosphaeraceae bacterium]